MPFLVADASADSSAPKTISRSTFFSRANASTSSSISRLIYQNLHIRDSEPGNQACLFNFFQGKGNLSLCGIQSDFTTDQPDKFADVIALVIDWHTQAQLHFIASKAFKILGLFQRSIKPGRGHFETVVIDVLHLKRPRELIADRCTIVHRDTALDINKHS